MLFPQVDVEYTEKMVSISNYPLSAALTCRLTTMSVLTMIPFSQKN